MAEPILALDDLCKAYGALKVTSHVSLDVRPGEIHAVIGPNGAGKTTLLCAAMGLLPSTGSLSLHGERIARQVVDLVDVDAARAIVHDLRQEAFPRGSAGDVLGRPPRARVDAAHEHLHEERAPLLLAQLVGLGDEVTDRARLLHLAAVVTRRLLLLAGAS